MRKSLLFISLVVLLLSSCQKSIVWDDLVLTPPTTPIILPGGGGTTGSLLTKIVSLTTADTITQSFFYDSTKKFIEVSSRGISNHKKKDDTYLFTRDASNKITNVVEIVYSTSSLNVSKYDTTYANIHYPFGATKFDYTINTLTSGGLTYRDSTYFTYNSEKIVSVKSYTFNSISNSYQFSSTKDYTYDLNSNIVTIKVSTSSSNPLNKDIAGDYKFEYDSKKSPLILSNEALITLGETYYGANNLTKLTLNITSPQAATVILVLSYNYNANSYPTFASGKATYQGLNSDSQSITYFYQ